MVLLRNNSTNIEILVSCKPDRWTIVLRRTLISPKHRMAGNQGRKDRREIVKENLSVKAERKYYLIICPTENRYT